MRRSTGLRLVAAAGVLALATTGCSSGSGSKNNGDKKGGTKAEALASRVADKATGPAYDVPGHTPSRRDARLENT